MDGIQKNYDLIVTNFANGDVIGHTSNDEARRPEAGNEYLAVLMSFFEQAKSFLSRHRDLAKKIAAVAVLALILFVIVRTGIFVTSKISQFINRHRKPLVSTQVSPSTAAVSSGEEQSSTPQDSEAIFGQMSEEALRLTIRARDDCWIKLIADGKTIFQSILPKGRSQTWQAEDRIELSLGRPQSVDLEVNGKIIPNLGRRPKPLKNILITKEGLIVPQ